MHQAPTTFEVDGIAIREKRMTAGIETAELAAVTGISVRFLNHLQSGTRTRIRPKRYAALRKALNANEKELLAPTTGPPEKSR